MSSQIGAYRALAAYNVWMNQRLYDMAAELSPEDCRRDLGAFFGSVFGTLNHILLADRIWLARFRASELSFTALAEAELVERFDSLGHHLCPDLASLRSARDATDTVISALVAELTPEALAAPLRYSNSKGEVRAHPFWIALTHLFNHQTHHRGQVTTLLKQLGHDPGITDFLIHATS